MARDREKRLEKQKERQRKYRARLKAERRPTNEDLARAVLDIALTRYLGQGRHDDLMRILDQVAERLQEVGFKARDTETAWFDLQDRYQRGWSLLRQRCSAAQLDALVREAETH
jgi:hypothetical protein